MEASPLFRFRSSRPRCSRIRSIRSTNGAGSEGRSEPVVSPAPFRARVRGSTGENTCPRHRRVPSGYSARKAMCRRCPAISSSRARDGVVSSISPERKSSSSKAASMASARVTPACAWNFRRARTSCASILMLTQTLPSALGSLAKPLAMWDASPFTVSESCHNSTTVLPTYHHYFALFFLNTGSPKWGKYRPCFWGSDSPTDSKRGVREYPPGPRGHLVVKNVQAAYPCGALQGTR